VGCVSVLWDAQHPANRTQPV